MKLKRGFIPIAIIGVLLVSLFAPLAVSAGEPVLPTSFYGDVIVNDTAAPFDTVITGRIVDAAGLPGEGTITVTEEGKYGVSGLGSKLSVTTDSLDDVGKEIEFYVKLPEWAEAQKATPDQPATYDSGTHELDLTVPTSEEPTYALTMVAAPVEGGTATDVTGLSPYEEGAEVSIEAVLAEGYHFVNWTAPAGAFADASQAETTFTMPGEAATVTANFALIDVTYTLTVASSAGGSVTTPGEPGPFTYESTTVVDLVAVPETDYEFVSWTGEVGTVGNVNEASTTITMNGNYSITANFGEIGVTYDLTVASTAGGSVTDPGEPGPFNYPDGTPVDLLAVADTGYQFANWTGDTADIANANAASTTITMNGNYSITANFAEVTGDLGEMIAGVEPGGTLELPAGTYTGNVTIDKPITITGTEGETIISGGILIEELTGSNVTIENLIITGYTDFGIRIVKVRDVDNFIIRNNTIQGAEENEIGIQVDAVEAGGILEVECNSISGNEIGIKLLEAVVTGNAWFNNIAGNDVGLELLAVGEHQVGAMYNWWGDISGPEEESWNPGGIGDNVTSNIGYYPWLTRDFQTVLDDNIAYFGLPAVELNTGWNIISTPIALDPLVEWVDSDNISRTGVDTWGNYIALGDGLSTDNTSPAYSFDAENQAWVGLTSDDTLEPCDAIYVRMAEPDIAPILYSPDVSVPSKDLYSGWNLVGLAWLPTEMEEVYGLPADEALITVAEVSSGFIGYKLVVSPSVNANEPSWIYIAGRPIDSWTDPNVWPPPDGYMLIASGYWVFMLNDGTLAGFTFTPVSLSMSPAPPEGD